MSLLAGRDRRDGVLVFLAGADAHDLLNRHHHDLAVAHFAGARRGDDRVDGRLHEMVGDADLETDFLGERHLDAGAAIILDVLDLAAMPLHAADRQAAYVGVKQRLEHIAQLLGPNDGDDQFHNPPRLSTAIASTALIAIVRSRGFTRMAPSPWV